MKTIIMMTAWRRPAYLERTLAAWAQVDGIHTVAEFMISLDASDRTPDMLDVIKGFHALNPRFTVQVNNPPRGVSVNPVDSGTELFRTHPGAQFLVLAEEDIIPSRDCLAWLSWAATTFAGEPAILCACAHQRKEGTDPRVARLSRDFAPWIWGTWRDRWFNLLEPTWDRDYSTADAEHPAHAGFDWNIYLRVMPRNRMATVMPDQSRSQNIGRDDGVHAAPEAWEDTQVASFREDQEPVAYRLEIDPASVRG